MVENYKELQADDIRRLFGKLDTVLAQHGEQVAVYLVGGANMALAVDGARTTTDIDAVVKAGFAHLARAARVVAAGEPGLADDWINAEFTGGDQPRGGLFWQWFDERDADTPATIFRGTGLTVEIASPEMMLALKTIANRDQDISDSFALMRKTKIKTPLEVGRNLARFTGRRIFDIQGTDGVYPRINPQFPHIFNNLPADLRDESAIAPRRLTWRERRAERQGRGRPTP